MYRTTDFLPHTGVNETSSALNTLIVLWPFRGCFDLDIRKLRRCAGSRWFRLDKTQPEQSPCLRRWMEIWLPVPLDSCLFCTVVVKEKITSAEKFGIVFCLYIVLYNWYPHFSSTVNTLVYYQLFLNDSWFRTTLWISECSSRGNCREQMDFITWNQTMYLQIKNSLKIINENNQYLWFHGLPFLEKKQDRLSWLI